MDGYQGQSERSLSQRKSAFWGSSNQVGRFRAAARWATAVSTLIGFNRHINYVDVTPELARIRCPTLVVTTEESGLGSVENTRAWQQLIPQSTLLVLAGNSYHVAATHAEECARAVTGFIERSRSARKAA